MPQRNPAPAPLNAPDERYLTALRDELERAFADQDAQIDRMRAVRAMTRRVLQDDAARFVDVEVRLGDVADECQRLAAVLCLEPPTLSVTPRKTGSQKADENATQREHWTEAVLAHAGSRRAGPPTLMRAADAVAADGGACTKLLYSPAIWEHRYALRLAYGEDAADLGSGDKPAGKPPPRAAGRRGLSFDEYRQQSEEAKQAAGPPFEWVNVDIRNVYPVFQGATIGEVLEVSERPRSATFRRYRLAYDAAGNIVPEELGEPWSGTASADGAGSGAGGSGSVTFVEHWDERYCTYLVVGQNLAGAPTGQVVLQWEHGYGRHPYCFAPGIWFGWWTNRKVGWSISESKSWLIEYYQFLLTQHAQMVARDTLPPVVVEVPDGAEPIRGADGSPRDVDRYELGRQYYGPAGTKRTPMQFPTTGAALNAHIALIQQRLDRQSGPQLEQLTDTSGFNSSTVLTEWRVKYIPLAQSLERMLGEATDFLWHLVRTKVGETVWVEPAGEGGWLGLGPEDLQPDVKAEWKLTLTLPSAELLEARYVHERVAAGTLDLHRAIERLGDNPDEIDLGKALDEMRRTPEFKRWQLEETFRYAGMGDLLVQQQAQQLAATGTLAAGAPGQPGMPGMPMGAPGAPTGGGMPGQGIAGPPAAMGNAQVPDLGALAAAPNGEGVRPMGGAAMPGSVPGQPSGPSVQTRAAVAALQSLGR